MSKFITENVPQMRRIPSNPFAFLWEAIYGFRKWAFFGMFSAFILSLSKVLLPVFFSNMVGYFSTISPQNFSWAKISVFLLQLLLVFLSASIMRFIREYTESRFVRNMMRIKLSNFGIDYIAKHSESYMAGQKAGQISQKILGLRDNTQKLHMFASRLYSCLFMMGITFFYIGRISIMFVLITIIVGLISSYFSYKKSFILKDLNREVVDRGDQYRGFIIDSISNIIAVKMFGRNKYEQDMIMSKFDDTRKARMIEINEMQNIVTMQRALLALFEICGALLAIHLWYNHKIDVKDVALILLLQGEAIGNFRRFLEEVSQLNRIYGEVSSSLTPFLIKHEIIDNPKARRLRVNKGCINFNNICFSYDGKNAIFDNFNLDIKAKEKVGIVGRSGSGKSTLINLLQHLYELDSGKILIDGKDISKVKQNSIFENIALIPQDTSLFHRTVKQNIAYGKEKANDKQIFDASKKAYADEFIKTLPQGYSTMVGEKGIKLSGGQRQRVAIARAILKDAPILILDEATSALDNESEDKISKSMKSLMKGKTVIAIAHRLSTLKEMDRIVVIDKGKIIETGTPEELIDKGGKFAKLWNLQEL